MPSASGTIPFTELSGTNESVYQTPHNPGCSPPVVSCQTLEACCGQFSSREAWTKLAEKLIALKRARDQGVLATFERLWEFCYDWK
jgi:hypothetical protein